LMHVKVKAIHVHILNLKKESSPVLYGSCRIVSCLAVDFDFISCHRLRP